jgi:hypothetical protein
LAGYLYTGSSLSSESRSAGFLLAGAGWFFYTILGFEAGTKVSWSDSSESSRFGFLAAAFPGAAVVTFF